MATTWPTRKEAPSIDSSSTSLVDTSSASDFASLALNLTGLTRGKQDDDDGSTDSGSVTASVYSLVAAIRGVALTDPVFYKRHTNLRRVTLTIGSEKSEADKHFTDKPATQLGFKLLLINHRDIYSPAAQVHFADMDIALADYTTVELAITNPLECVVFWSVHKRAGQKPRAPVLDCLRDPEFEAFLKGDPLAEKNWPAARKVLEADAAAMTAIQKLIVPLAAARAAAAEKVAEAVDRIRRGKQLSVAYFTKQREDEGSDEHRAELIYDHGLSTRLNWTVNASFDFTDRKTGDDTKSGRIATEFQAKLGGESARTWSARPVMLSGGGEASKEPDSDLLLRVQLKLVVPVTAGVDIPIAYSYANRDTDQFTSGSQLKFSLALDPVRLRERFR